LDVARRTYNEIIADITGEYLMLLFLSQVVSCPFKKFHKKSFFCFYLCTSNVGGCYILYSRNGFVGTVVIRHHGIDYLFRLTLTKLSNMNQAKYHKNM